MSSSLLLYSHSASEHRIAKDATAKASISTYEQIHTKLKLCQCRYQTGTAMQIKE